MQITLICIYELATTAVIAVTIFTSFIKREIKRAKIGKSIIFEEKKNG